MRHWDPSTFDQPWLDEYRAAPPERRADLDLAQSPAPANLQAPLALAFYWVRFLPLGDHQEVVFLPGFKADKVVDIPVTASLRNGETLWKSPLRYRALSETPVSAATVLMSPDRHLTQLTMDIYQPRGEGRGVLTQEGCDGPPVLPSATSR